MFKYFLVSSQVHQEKNAMSEAAWILSTYVEVETFKVKLLPVGGLGLLVLENGIDLPESINDTIDELLQKEKLYYCFKVIPLEYFEVFTDDLLHSWIENNKQRISENESWKVNLNKRHTSLKSRELVNTIAKLINNPVELKNPDLLLQVEIIGKYIGLGLLKPYQFLQLSQKISHLPNEEQEEDETTEIGGY